MKSAWLFILLFFIPITFHAQKTLTGLWTGTLSNDSVTVRKDQSFEIVLTQYKQKVYGYSRATFIVNDTLFYIMKRVKGTIVNDVCEVTDDEIISFNFRGKLDKGIKVTHTFHMNKNDSTWSLSGDWTTNKTKKFYSISGKVDLKDEPDMEKSKIIPHLEELNLAKDVQFYVETKQKEKDEELRRIAATTRKDPPVAKATGKPTKTEPKKSEPVVAKTNTAPAENKPVSTSVAAGKQDPIATVTEKPAITEPTKSEPVATITEPKKTQPDPVITKPASAEVASGKPDPIKTAPVAAVTEQKKPQAIPVENKPASTNVATGSQEPVASVTQKPVVNEPKNPTTADATAGKPATTNPTPGKPEPVATVTQKPAITPVVAKPEPVKSDPVAITENHVTSPKRNEPAATLNNERKIIPANTQPRIFGAIAAAQVTERRTAPPQIVSFVSDSLVFAIYDNGEIDGDTVSVLMNGELMLVKQGLKATAIKKTIYMDPANEEVTMILYAENLGKYPPNTGLLVVYDGEERYQIRFSADLQQNASVVFRRKKK